MARPICSMSSVGLSWLKWMSSPNPTMAWVKGGPAAFFLPLRVGAFSGRLIFSSLTTRSNLLRISFWSSRMLSDSSKSQTTVSLCWATWRRISRAIWSSASPTSPAANATSPPTIPPRPRSRLRLTEVEAGAEGREMAGIVGRAVRSLTGRPARETEGVAEGAAPPSAEKPTPEPISVESASRTAWSLRTSAGSA